MALTAVTAALAASAAIAHADTDVQAQCESPEVGGIFGTTVVDGAPRSVCGYTVEGYYYVDTFSGDEYTGTSVYRDGAQVPTERPTIPELFEVPENLPFLP